MQRLEQIDRLDAVRAVADPNRLLLMRLLLARPQTITSLGTALDKHPAWIRHHIKALEVAGLVRMVEERTTRNYTEKFYGATAAAFTVSLLIRPDAPSSLVALVSDDLVVDLLASAEDERARLVAGVTGSLDGLIGVRQGLADIAGCHLLDTDTGQYNIPFARHLFPDRDVMVVTLAHREQGLIVASGNPLGITGLAEVADGRVRLANRNRGSGTRVWIDRALHEAGISGAQVAGYDDVADTHSAAAERVASGRADVAVGIAAAAERHGLSFVPLFRERYDLVMPEEIFHAEEVARLLDRLHTSAFRRTVSRIRGYDSTSTGDEYRLAI